LATCLLLIDLPQRLWISTAATSLTEGLTFVYSPSVFDRPTIPRSPWGCIVHYGSSTTLSLPAVTPLPAWSTHSNLTGVLR
jgi:hypothetical protein